MANQISGACTSRASAKRSPSAILVAVAAAATLAGCASAYRAPIVHRTEPPPAQPSAAQPPAVPPVATLPPPAQRPSEPEGPSVQTVPIPRGSIESRPLPGAAAGAGAAPSASAGANLLKTEPKALKQPYSDAALAQMKSAAASEAPPPVAMAPQSAPKAPEPPAAQPGAAPSASDAGFIWPADGQVVQDFSEPRSMGIAIAGKPGDPIVAVGDGRVIFSGAGPRPYGNLIIVKHSNDTLSVYAHNRTLLVKEGQSVRRGQRIAELGNFGNEGARLHFEMRDKQGKPVDPRKYLPGR